MWDLQIPFIACRSYGFIGYIRVQVAEHTVIETHPDNQIPDLRLDRPFPSLKKYVDSIDLEAMEYKDHAHVPYLIILYKYLQQWKAEHNGQLPKNYKEKEDFKSTIRKGMFYKSLTLYCFTNGTFALRFWRYISVNSNFENNSWNTVHTVFKWPSQSRKIHLCIFHTDFLYSRVQILQNCSSYWTLTPWYRISLVQFIFTLLINIFPRFYWTLRFITLFLRSLSPDFILSQINPFFILFL